MSKENKITKIINPVNTTKIYVHIPDLTYVCGRGGNETFMISDTENTNKRHSYTRKSLRSFMLPFIGIRICLKKIK